GVLPCRVATGRPCRRPRARLLGARRGRGLGPARDRRGLTGLDTGRHHSRPACGRHGRADGRGRGDLLPAPAPGRKRMTTADPARNDYDPALAAAAERTQAQKLGIALSRSWLFIFLLLMIAFFWLTTPSGTFFSHTNLTQIALSTSEVVLLAIGQTFIIVTAGIDLSIGGIVFLAGVCGGEVMLKLAGTNEQVVINGEYPHASI